MKKMLSIFCALALLGCAAAEPAEPQVQEMLLNKEVLFDLDGDGAQETLQTQMIPQDGEEYLRLNVTAADGAVSSYDTEIMYVYGLYLLDMDGDGVAEIMLTGDVYSDDYATWILHYSAAEGLVPLPFEDANRGDNTDERFDYGYGMFNGIDGLNLTLTGSQDVLGTWFASRTFTLRDGVFVLEDGGLWQMWVDPEDAYIWEYACLNLTRDLPVTLDDGSAATLKAGEKFIVTRSDKISIVHFLTRSGLTGSFPIAPDLENNWGSLIEGVNEYEWFEYVPYAD